MFEKLNYLKFPGQYLDYETGTHYNFHRDYAPNDGRYITSDLIGLRGGLNRWLYVQNNPLDYFDIKGLELSGTFDLSTGVLELQDNDTGQTVTAIGFSGFDPNSNWVNNPTPNGDYIISDFPSGSSASPDYFALVADDSYIDDYVDGSQSNYEDGLMSSVRLHVGNVSHGCATIPRFNNAGHDQWSPVRDLINNTSQGTPINIQGVNYPNYGNITVTGSGHGVYISPYE